MNGRCETDPLDAAVDVCQRCFGEFCEACLVKLPGRKHPFCTQCAINASGVRGSEPATLRGDRRTAKARRRALQEARPGRPAFQFFDEVPTEPEIADVPTDPNGPDGTEAADPAEPDGDRRPEPRPGTPAMRRLDALRRTGGDGVTRPDAPAPAPAPTRVIELEAPALDVRPAEGGDGADGTRGDGPEADEPGAVIEVEVEEVEEVEVGDHDEEDPGPVEHRRGQVLRPGRADTDPNGNWIPPILRGLSADADEAKTALPHRRRPTD
ncbi:MAG: hypothetical protein ACK5RL_19175 [Acidimicrobiales bacterium]